MRINHFFLVFLFISYSLFVGAQELYIGPKTELRFDEKNIKYLPFEPCPEDRDSSCATLEKVDSNGTTFKSKKVCTFKVKNENVSKLEIKGRRILTVKEVNKNTSNEVISLILEGAKSPIHLSCVSEFGYLGNITSIREFPLQVEVLKDFKEFDLPTIGTVVKPQKELEPTPEVKKNPISTGKSI